MSQSANTSLAEFAQSRAESAFRRVVDEFGGLVMQAALRRTGDRGLAEEVTQNVFSIMASKARSLAKHGSLAGWVFTTTRLESSKALRGRQRHLRKIDALTKEFKSVPAMNDEDSETWRDALPHLEAGLDQLSDGERDVLLARFFEEKSFQEIAQKTGKSESACKMRVQRSLEKLNSWLVGRGISLSVGTLGTALSSEWAMAATPAVSASISAKALAAAPSIGAGTILTNTLMTMNTVKSAAVAATAILMAGSVPLAVQHAKASGLQREVEELRTANGRLPAPEPSRGGTALSGSGTGGLTPARLFIAKNAVSRDPDAFLDALMTAAMSQNMVAMMRVILPVSRMENAELEALIAEYTREGANPMGKQVAVPILMGFLDQESGAEALLDRALKSGVPIAPLTGKLSEWAKKKPAAALAWYERNRAGHAFEGTGVNDSQELYVLMGLLPALAEKDPVNAIAVLQGTDRDIRDMLRGEVVGIFFTQGKEGLERGREVLLATGDTGMRLMAFTGALKGNSGADLKEVEAIVGSLGFDPDQEAAAQVAVKEAAERRNP